MRFDAFMGNLERDVSTAPNMSVEKTKDIKGRPFVSILRNGRVLAEVRYSPNYRGKMTRAVNLFTSDGRLLSTINATSLIMAEHLVSHLRPFMKLHYSSCYIYSGK